MKILEQLYEEMLTTYLLGIQREKDTLATHGCSTFLNEKMRDHSDKYTVYICRCGREAIVNKEEEIYKCRFCGDNADIIEVPSTYTSKLFKHELMSCQIGVSMIPEPFTFESFDDEKRTGSQVAEKYNPTNVKNIYKHFENLIDDIDIGGNDD